jgi:trehalose/maltose hydrolase-like predicted phosphorylase
VHSEGAIQPLRQARTVGREIHARLQRGEALSVEARVVMAYGAGATAEADRAMTEAIRQDLSSLRRSHVEAMAKLWNGFDAQAADPFLERKLRACMFYLMSIWRDDVVWGGSAAGLSQSAWGGSVFWDTEMYMYPPMLMFQPALARNILRYRTERLDGARANAEANGEKGARIPWESRSSGRVVSPSFDAERHIGPDVAVAAWWYGNTTGDDAFMRKDGWPLIVEIARHCASISRLNQQTGLYEIHGVIPPDEHVLDHHVGAPINNSVMTNYYCAWTLKVASEQAPDNLLTDDERKHWQQIAAAMYYPRDAARQIYLEYDGYNGHAIKQADVGHLFFPLCITDDSQEIARNVNYYADRERETGLHLMHSSSVYGIGLARAGDAAGVLRHFLLAERTCTGPFEVPRESNYATGPVITGAGGYLNLVLFGLMGINTMGTELTARPCLPQSIGRISIAGIHFRGRQYRVTVEPDKADAEITVQD